jgi:hypothetical protein
MKGLPAKRFSLHVFPERLHAGFSFYLSSLSGVPELYHEVFRFDRALHPVSTTDRHLRFCVEPPGKPEDIVEGTWTH